MSVSDPACPACGAVHARALGGCPPRSESDRTRVDGRLIQTLEEEMHEASAELRFEYAARLRDEIAELRRELRDAR